MKASEVVEIIKACKGAGVRSLRLGDLALWFGAKPEPDMVFPLAPQADPQEEEARRVENEVRIKQERLEILRLSDPLAYEDLIRQDELGATDD